MLATEITALREKLGLSMSALAARLNVPVEWVVDWENGERFPTKKHHEALLVLQKEGGTALD